MCWREEAQIFISDPTPKLTNEKPKNRKAKKKRNEKKVVKETKKTRTDDAAFLVDLLLLPR